MKNPVLFKAICLVYSVVFISCSGINQTTSTKNPDSIIVGEVDGTEITYGELKESFSTGSASGDNSLTDLKEFLPVYLDYRAKLVSAQESGYFDDETVLEEYELYSKQAAYSYWLENKIRPALFDEFKSKYDLELKSSHLLVALPQNATPADTLEAYNSLIEARDKFLNGVSMPELDASYSTKRQGRSMGGDLPWFTQGTTVPEFEDVLFSLDVGEISMPFRTQFGYHVVLLEDKRERQPDRRLSHIFVNPNFQARIDSAYVALKKGQSWSEAVIEYTMDTPSSSNGGLIGWVNYGSRYRSDFVDSAMQVDPENAFSEPVQTSYGYHIFRVDTVRTFTSVAEKDKFLMEQLESSNSFRKSNTFVTSWLNDTYSKGNHTEIRERIATDIKAKDSLLISDYQLPAELGDQKIFEVDDMSFSTSDFVDYLKETRGERYSLSFTVNWFNDFEQAMIDANLTNLTLKYFPDFSSQTKNYLNGLVVYQINEDSVWSAATVDTTELRSIYENNPEEYTYDTRYWYHMISSGRDTSLEKAINFVLEGGSPDSIRARGISVAVSTDSTGAFQSEPFDKLAEIEIGTFSEKFKYNNRDAVFYLNDILPPRPMTFDEAFNRLLSVYQPVREQEWLQRMRNKYSIKTYPDKLEEAYSLDYPSE